MKSIIISLLVISLISLNKCEMVKNSITYINGNWEISEFDNPNWVAKAAYNKSMMDIGTNTLSLTTNNLYSDEIQAEAAGRIEGHLTKDEIYLYSKNYYANNGGKPKYEVQRFFEEQEKYIQNMFQTKSDDPHVYITYLMYLQLKGMREQYNISQTDSDKKMEPIDFHVITAAGDLADIEEKFEDIEYHKMNETQLRDHFLKKTHCSALFKVKKDFTDFYMGHNSWDDYTIALRILKEYNLNFNYPYVKAKNIMFSSYPASLSSNDDFYITSRNLVVIETTNEFYNGDLIKRITPKSFLCYHRVMVASRMAVTPEEWANAFKEYNSGTYNNQFMIFDVKKVNITMDYQSMEPGTLYIIETVPEYYAIHDVTDFLKYGYWPSYNNPYDENIRLRSHMTEQFNPEIAKVRDLLDYDICSRAIIFRREQTNIDNLEDFKKMMRYNNYDKDPHNNDPCGSIAARCDLKRPDPTKKQSCAGAYDAKVISVSELLGPQKYFYFIPGPTDDVPDEKFSYSKSEACKNTSRDGIPDTFDFGWFKFTNTYPMEEN